MNELKKMKLRMSRNSGEPGGGGSGNSEEEERARKYEALKDVPTFFDGFDSDFTGMENELRSRGFSPNLITRTSLGKPFEPEEFELFLLRFIACVYSMGDQIKTLKEEVQALKNKG